MMRNCPVCGGRKGEAIKRIYMTLPEGTILPEQYDIVSCTECGFCYADTSAKKEDYDAYYTLYNSYSGKEESQEAIISQTPVLEFIKTNLELKSCILDIGFGNGMLLRNLRELGYQNLFGLDPSEDSVRNLENYGIECAQGTIYDCVSRLENSFDAVVMTAVLEHLLEPREAIEQVFTYLKDGGYFILSVPDYSMCYTVQFSIPNQFNQEHINYFSEDSLLNLFQGSRLMLSDLVEIKDTVPASSEFLRIFAVQKCAEIDKQAPDAMKKDTRTKGAIERYLVQQEDHQRKNEQIIADLCAKQTPLVIWGTGSMVMQLLVATDLAKCNILTFVDGNYLKVGTSINGIKVQSPAIIRDYPEAAVLVCAMKFGQEIQRTIEELGLNNQVLFFN